MTRDRPAQAPPDPGIHPYADEDASTGLESGSAAGPPRWLIALGVFLVILMLALLHLTGAVGPGAH